MKVDMSAQAVTARLKLASQLRRLCLSLGKARHIERGADSVNIASSRKNQPRTNANQ